MTSSAAPTTPSQIRKAAVAQPATPPPRRAALDPAALAELRNAGATYDFLRRKGDPAQFWEMLRLARCRRAIVAPPEGAAPAPAPEVDAAMAHELESIRFQCAPLVRDLRNYLKNVPGLPEPADRFEMALAFLLASPREHQAVAKWLAEPGRHEAKAAEKLRSLAAITDPYREALQPWTLQTSDVKEAPEVHFAEIDLPAPAPASPPPPPPRPAPPAVDPRHLETLRRAVECRKILAGIPFDAELWEAMVVATMKPQTVSAVLEQLSKTLNGDLLKQAQLDGLALDTLCQDLADLRGRYGKWVGSLRAFLADAKLAPEDPRVFDVGFGFMLATPGAQDRLESWREDPSTWQEEVLGLLGPWMRRAQDCLAVSLAFGP